MARLIIMILIPFTAILVKYSVIKVRKWGVFLHLYFKSLFKEQKVLSTMSSFISYLAETNDRILLLDREWYFLSLKFTSTSMSVKIRNLLMKFDIRFVLALSWSY